MTSNISDGLLTKFTTSNLMLQGDDFVYQIRDLLGTHLHLLEINDQQIIRKKGEELVWII
jgi:hypothetical protein